MRASILLSAALCAALGVSGVGAAWADSPVVIDGADEETREAILDLLPDRDEPSTLFEAERIAEEAAARAMAWLRSEGYYAAEVTPEATEDPVRARLVIAPGARFRFDAPQLTFNGSTPDPAAEDAARDAIGRVSAEDPARAAAVLEAEATAVSELQKAGYADATAAPRRVVVDHASGKVQTHFNIASGPLVRLGAVRAEPGDVFRASYLNRLRNWSPGEPYAPDKLAQLRRDLTTTGAVARVSTRLEPAGEDGVRDVVLEIEPAKRNAYELGVGFSTTEGAGVEAEWTRRNITGRADSLTLATTLGELLQSVDVTLVRPHAAGLGHAQRIGAQVSREDTTAFTRQGVALTASVDAAPRLRMGASYGLRLSADQYEDASGSRDAYVLSAFGNLRHDTTQASLDPRDGSIVEFNLEPSISTGDATLGFIRTTGEGRVYESFGDEDRLTLAARTRLGWIVAVSGDVDDAPPDRRFYAGGGGSVRGYEYNSIYPRERDQLGLTPGGQGLVEISAEARWRFGERWGAVAFIDGGNAFDTWQDAAELKWGVGVGARYDLGFAPLRFDIALPLDPADGEPSYALYISLGQAF